MAQMMIYVIDMIEHVQAENEQCNENTKSLFFFLN